MRFATTKQTRIKPARDSGQALIELVLTVSFFVLILLSLQKMVRAYQADQSRPQRMTYDISRPN